MNISSKEESRVVGAEQMNLEEFVSMVFNHPFGSSTESVKCCLMGPCLQQSGVIGVGVCDYSDQETQCLKLLDLKSMVVVLMEVGMDLGLLLGEEFPLSLTDGFNQ